MKVRIPTPLRSYTNQEKWVESSGATVADVLADLDTQFRGIRFRVVDEQGRLRQHMKIFVNQDAVRDLATPVTDADEVTIMQALSGGCGPAPAP
ncbi:MAG: sulfur-carrier protein [Acidimicrobiaceae bacterium]